VTRTEPYWPGVNHAAGPHLSRPARTRPTRSSAIPRESGIRLSPPPEILSRPPACHCQARQDTRCTDSPAGRRPGLGRAPVTQYRSCTPRARRELRRSRPLEHRHSGCTGTTAASGDSDTPPWAAPTRSDNPAGHQTPGPQDRKPSRRAISHDSRSCSRFNRDYYPEAGHRYYRTWARHPAIQTIPRLATRTKKIITT
jgi:hypothetical protein